MIGAKITSKSSYAFAPSMWALSLLIKRRLVDQICLALGSGMRARIAAREADKSASFFCWTGNTLHPRPDYAKNGRAKEAKDIAPQA
jgi:hypothetical protein